MSYTNSAYDRDIGAEGRQADEGAVRRMYEHAPYPDLGANLKDAASFFAPVVARYGARADRLSFIDVGCGTGHLLVGAAKAFPGWTCHGVDLSQASLDVARQLADKHGATVELARASYLDPLPFETKTFDLISAQGTIHHAADPAGALGRLREVLADDGYLSMHLYGWRLDRGKFEVKEMLSILEPDLFAHDTRFKRYRELMAYRNRWTLRRLAAISPLDIYVGLKTALRNARRRRRGQSWSPPWTDDYTKVDAPWIDHFCHPCERAYEVPDVERLVRDSGFEVVEMRTQGRPDERWLPPEWRAQFRSLDPWQQYRLMELLSPSETSFNMVLKKAGV